MVEWFEMENEEESEEGGGIVPDEWMKGRDARGIGYLYG